MLNNPVMITLGVICAAGTIVLTLDWFFGPQPKSRDRSTR
jgi:fumarate reductase subunit C